MGHLDESPRALLRDLGLLSEASYKRAMVQYSKNGWQNGEPGELENTEQPVFVSNALEVLRTRRGLDSEDLARAPSIESEDLEKLASAPMEMTLAVPLGEGTVLAATLLTHRTRRNLPSPLRPLRREPCSSDRRGSATAWCGRGHEPPARRPRARELRSARGGR